MNKKLVGCALAIFAYALINSAHAAPIPLASGLVNGDSVVNDPNSQKAWANTLGSVVAFSGPNFSSFFNTVDLYINQLNAEQYGGVTGWRLPRGLEMRDLFGYSLGNPGQHQYSYSSPSGAVTNWGPIQKAKMYWLAESELTLEVSGRPFVVFGYDTTGSTMMYNPYGLDCPCRDWIPGELSGQTFSILAVRDGLVSGIPVPTFTVGGTVSGLASGKTVVLKNNNNTVLVSSTSPGFTFPAQNAGTSWNVSVAIQPSGQTCTVTNGSGTSMIADVTNVSVDCANTYTVSGSISGLTGTLVLRMGGVSLLVASGKNSFKFASRLRTGAIYNVQIAIQPPGLSCGVSSGLGTISSSDVTNVSVTCVNTYTVSGTISGLAASGLTLKLTYTPTDSSPIAISKVVSSGATSFAFSNGLKNGSAYQLDVIGQPIGLTCLVLNGLGNINSANVTDISIFCTPTTYTISGTTDGATVVASGSTVSNTVTTNAGSYSLRAKYGDAVTLSASKTGYSNCIVSASPITVTSDTTANVSGCTANKYRVGGTITDAPLVNGGQIGLTINGNLYTFTSNGSFSFPVDLVSGSTYDVRVGGLYSFPSNWAYKCIVSNGVGSVTSSDVTNVQITCDPNLARRYPFYLNIGGLKYSNTVALGLHTSGPLGVKDESYSFGGSDLRRYWNLDFIANANISPGIVYATSYEFSILSQPLGQICSIRKGSGTLLYDLGSTGLIVGPWIDCSPYYWSVSGQITGYSNSGSGLLGLTLTDLTSGSVVSTLSSITDGSTSFDFKSNIQAGHAWGVTVTNQPTNLSCLVVNGTGTNINNDVTSVSIQCQPITYTVSGSISGLTASGLSLLLSGSKSDSVSPPSGATSYTFTQTLVNGNSYTVAISTQPTGQTCALSPNPATGTVGTTNVVVNVSCVQNAYFVSFSLVDGTFGEYKLKDETTGVVLSQDVYPVVNGVYTFSTPVPRGHNYSVTVVRAPRGKTCLVLNGSGLNINSDVSNVSISCQYYFLTIGGTLTGLAPGQMVTVTMNGGGSGVFPTFGPTCRLYINGSFDCGKVSFDALYSLSVTQDPANQVCIAGGNNYNSGWFQGTAEGRVDIPVNCVTVQPPTVAFDKSSKQVILSWPSYIPANYSGGTDYTYKISKDISGSSTYTQVCSTAGLQCTETYSNLTEFINAKYKLLVCGPYPKSGCAESAPINAFTAESIQYLKASNTDASDNFGGSVALSADGNTLAVGAYYEASAATGINGNQADNSACDINHLCAGAVYVYTRSGTNWSQQAYIKASNTNANDAFGYSVALSADGSTLAVGAYGEDSAATGINGNQADNSATDAGAVYVYTRSGTNWSQQAYIKASNTDAGDGFGRSVALSADGNTLAMAAGGEDSAATGINGNQVDNSAYAAGAVYVYTRSGTNWSQQAYIKASNTNVGDLFGSSVALSADGNTLAVAAGGEDSAATGINGNQADNSALGAGAVYVYTRSGTNWSQQAYIKASNTNAPSDIRVGGDNFGSNIALSADGGTLAVGAQFEDGGAIGINGNQYAIGCGATPSGAVYIFTRLSNAWSQQAYVKASNTNCGDFFGSLVSLSTDGNTLAVSARGEASNSTGVNGNQADNSDGGAGAVYVYTRSGTNWSQQAYIKASNTNAGDDFGSSVALSGDGSTLAVGAYGEDSAATGINGNQADNSAAGAGAVYVY